MQIKNTAKYTAVLPLDDMNELKRMAAEKHIASVNQGIRDAVARYIAQEKKQRYARDMRAAAQDEDFMARTAQAQEAFAPADAEGMGEW